MEESGRIRRGYFVAGLGATQFALPGALDLLRSLRDPSAGMDEDVRGSRAVGDRSGQPLRVNTQIPRVRQPDSRENRRRDGDPDRRRDRGVAGTRAIGSS